MFVQDYILNGQGHGETAGTLADLSFDTGLLRPYFDKNGERCVDRTENGKTQKMRVAEVKRLGIDHPVLNATSLRKEQWVYLDSKVQMAYRQRLRAWADLSARNSVGGFDAMANPIFEYERQSDPGEAVQDMDGISEPRGDTPLFSLQGIPLPITQSGFYYTARQLAASRKSGQPLSTTMAEAAGRRIAEMIEKQTIGVLAGVTHGGTGFYNTAGSYGRASAVYGYTNAPFRLTKTNMTVPTGSNPEATVSDVLLMRDTLYDNRMYGPFMVYHSTNWDKFLDNDYARLGGNNASQTLRQRLMAIEGIEGVRRLDFLTPTTTEFTMIMVQMTSDVAQAINGMDVTTVQWETRGGMQLNFKVMAIQVPLLKDDYAGRTGILHGSTA